MERSTRFYRDTLGSPADDATAASPSSSSASNGFLYLLKLESIGGAFRAPHDRGLRVARRRRARGAQGARGQGRRVQRRDVSTPASATWRSSAIPTATAGAPPPLRNGFVRLRRAYAAGIMSTTLTRIEAAKRFDELPLPSTKDEHWRFTSLRGFAPDGQVPGTVPGTRPAEAMLDLDVAGPRGRRPRTGSRSSARRRESPSSRCRPTTRRS